MEFHSEGLLNLVRVYLLYPDSKAPQYGMCWGRDTLYSLIVYAVEECEIPPSKDLEPIEVDNDGKRCLVSVSRSVKEIPTGLGFGFPVGYELSLRTSDIYRTNSYECLGLKFRHPSDSRASDSVHGVQELNLVYCNYSDTTLRIPKGQALAELVLMPLPKFALDVKPYKKYEKL